MFIAFRSRMSSIGSLGLNINSILRYFMHGGQSVNYHRVLVPPSSYIDSVVLHQEASLQRICAHAANKLTISPCIPTASALLLYHYYYCCMACTYCQQCCDTSVHSTAVPPLLYVYIYIPP